MLRVFAIVMAALAAGLLSQATFAEEDSGSGKVTGGVRYTIPGWFKSSFLDFDEEVAEAREQGKHVIAFLHLDECPYCARMLDENFREGEARAFMEERFEVIAVNVLGDLPVDWIDGETYSEKELTKHLKAIGTPTVVFLDFDGNKVLQLSGYRDAGAYRHALEYVDGKRYRTQSFADYAASMSKAAVYRLRTHPGFEPISYFKDLDKPLAVVFEDESCVACDDFHDNTLNHPDVLEALNGYHVVRLDTRSDRKLVDPQGKVTTTGQWARDLGLTFRPAVVLFNDGKEMFRADGLLYHHHLSEALRYVSEGYREYPTLDEFKTAYREALIRSGKDVDFSE